MAYAPDVAALVGNTPLVRINRVTDGAPTTVLAKMEAFKPAAPIEDRIALSIVRAVETSGDLRPDGTIVEVTPGNTGVGLAVMGATLGYKVIITMPRTMSKERRAIMHAPGVELVLTTEGGVAGVIKRAEEIQAVTPNLILASQFANPANPKAHHEATVREILEQTEDDIDVFVVSIGIGDTLTGVSQVLRQEKPRVKVYSVKPSESLLLSEDQTAPHKVQDLGPNVVPEIPDQDIWDELLYIKSDVAITYIRQAATEEDLLVGISLGATLAATSELARRPEFEGKTIIAALPDTGERCLSTPLFKDFLD